MGNKPGVTRSVLEKIRVHNSPLVYLIDTPGVMMPNIRDKEMGLKLGLCGRLTINRPVFTFIRAVELFQDDAPWYTLVHLTLLMNFKVVT